MVEGDKWCSGYSLIARVNLMVVRQFKFVNTYYISV